MTQKIKKQSDLWEIFKGIQKKHVDACRGPKILGVALANIEWEGYATGLFEFGVITKKEFSDLMAWRNV
jgi:hypothetical protein